MRMHIEMVDRYKFIAQLDRMWEESNESLCLTIYIFQLFIKFSYEEKYYCEMSKQLKETEERWRVVTIFHFRT